MEHADGVAQVLKDIAGVELPPAALKYISIEGGIARDGVRKTLAQRKSAIDEQSNNTGDRRAISQYTLSTRLLSGLRRFCNRD